MKKYARNQSGFWIAFFMNLFFQGEWLMLSIIMLALYYWIGLPLFLTWLCLGIWIGWSMFATFFFSWISSAGKNPNPNAVSLTGKLRKQNNHSQNQ